MPGPGFAVIDVETTGFSPALHDRIVEIAVVHVSPDGTITGRWDTLVNPGRDLGAQRIHGIRAVDVLDAPAFSEIARELVRLLEGRVIVAHNARFDLAFVNAELERSGFESVREEYVLCTMLLAREFLPGVGRSLVDCCEACGIALEGAHRALVDANATAELLGVYLGLSDSLGWDAVVSDALASAWSAQGAIPTPERVWHPRGTVDPAEPVDFLTRLADRLPELAGPEEHQDYLAVLDRCLIDRHLSEIEKRELVRTADDLGIGRATARRLHHEYFTALVALAWEDGILTTDEMADLARVASLLSIDASVLGAVLVAAPKPFAGGASTVAKVELVEGAQIVLTGEMQRPREHWHALLVARGYVPRPAVTKKIALVAAADPDSLSGKAKKAREYGIPVVGEQWLSEKLGV